jgi:hypothetical protein
MGYFEVLTRQVDVPSDGDTVIDHLRVAHLTHEHHVTAAGTQRHLARIESDDVRQ